MTSNQRTAVAVGAIVIGLIGLFPPWVETGSYSPLLGGYQQGSAAGYHPVFLPPGGARIDIGRLLAQWIAVTGLLGAAYLLLGRASTENRERARAAAQITVHGPAGRARRFFTVWIDNLTVAALTAMFLAQLSVSYSGYDRVFWTVFLMCYFGYYVVLESVFRKTLGKLLMGTEVVAAGDGRLFPGLIVLRTLCRFIPFDQFSIFFDDETTWHDRLSKTRVIHRRKVAATAATV